MNEQENKVPLPLPVKWLSVIVVHTVEVIPVRCTCVSGVLHNGGSCPPLASSVSCGTSQRPKFNLMRHLYHRLANTTSQVDRLTYRLMGHMGQSASPQE
jgi:hypothetical protein